MKKVLITFLLLLFSFSFAFAQEHSDEDDSVVITVKRAKPKEPKKEVKPVVTYAKHSVGLNVGFNYSFANVDFGVTTQRFGGASASVGFEYKRTFSKWFGMLVNLGYDNLKSDLLYNTVDHHALNFNFLFAFQRETPKGQSGLVPYLGVGPNFQFAGPLWFAPGIVIGAGLRYNFSFGLYLAIGLDYQFNINAVRRFISPGYDFNTHQIRGKIAVGYRY